MLETRVETLVWSREVRLRGLRPGKTSQTIEQGEAAVGVVVGIGAGCVAAHERHPPPSSYQW